MCAFLARSLSGGGVQRSEKQSMRVAAVHSSHLPAPGGKAARAWALHLSGTACRLPAAETAAACAQMCCNRSGSRHAGSQSAALGLVVVGGHEGHLGHGRIVLLATHLSTDERAGGMGSVSLELERARRGGRHACAAAGRKQNRVCATAACTAACRARCATFPATSTAGSSSAAQQRPRRTARPAGSC